MTVQCRPGLIYPTRSDFEAKVSTVAKYALVTAAITTVVKQVLAVDPLYIAPAVLAIGFAAVKMMEGALELMRFHAIVSQHRSMQMNG